MRRKIVKNVLCIIGFVILIAAYCVLHIQRPDIPSISYVLPIFMMLLALAIFSLLWSMRESGKVNTMNISFILITVSLALIYIILQAVTVVFLNEPEPNKVMGVSQTVFMVLSGFAILMDFIYSCYIDFAHAKKLKEN